MQFKKIFSHHAVHWSAHCQRGVSAEEAQARVVEQRAAYIRRAFVALNVCVPIGRVGTKFGNVWTAHVDEVGPEATNRKFGQRGEYVDGGERDQIIAWGGENIWS